MKKACQSYPNGRVYIWRFSGGRFDPNLVEDKSTSGRFSCNFHGLWVDADLTELTLIDGHFNFEKYCKILANTVLPTMDYFEENLIPFFMYHKYSINTQKIWFDKFFFRDFLVFLCSNLFRSLIHTSNYTEKFIDNNYPAFRIYWPSKGVDMNHIENA